jgi:elongation factor Ts
MHIAAYKPVALSREQVPADLIDKEREIARQKAAESGKPANIVEKMVEGGVQKYLKEVTLLGQPFVRDDKLTVEQMLKSNNAQVERYLLYVVGQGIEKKQSDFAAEVMAQAGLAVKPPQTDAAAKPPGADAAAKPPQAAPVAR